MKIVSVKEVKNNQSYNLKSAEKEDFIITKSGRANAVLHHVEEVELEDYLLEHDPKFRRKIEKRWNLYLQKGGRSLEEVLRGFEG